MNGEIIFPLGLLLLLVGTFMLRGASLAPAARTGLIIRIVCFTAFAALVITLAATGQQAAAIGLSVFAVPLSMRAFRFGAAEKPAARAKTGVRDHITTMQTQYLFIKVNQQTRAISGEVIDGRFAGARLDSLTFDDLIALYADYRGSDPRSAGALRSYIDRTQPPDWRERAQRYQRTQQNSDEKTEAPPPRPATGKMQRDEALAILGLKDASPSVDDIKSAHRRLMKRLHPDQGGTDYLAAKINEAKELLIDGKP